MPTHFVSQAGAKKNYSNLALGKVVTYNCFLKYVVLISFKDLSAVRHYTVGAVRVRRMNFRVFFERVERNKAPTPTPENETVCIRGV